jgi:cytochrome c-type biogenesis protein CcmH/NrfG
VGADPDVIAALQQVVGREPDNLPLTLHLATLMLDAGRHGEAARLARRVLEVAPADPGALEVEARASAAARGPLRLLRPLD